MAKIKKAVALGYNKKKDNAPKVLASGKGEIASKIIEAARKYEIPIKEDSDLVEILSKVDINQEIPSNLYKAVAEIFSFLYRATKIK
ncbi:FlhB-like flagellar biosynthesis protein [Campylobacter hyointestinalis]|uniref:FlhB-like flagellar biosynthesis protein n=2 Tax=Campylobacter hyointestinalis TaxID=198 RepID=A0AAV6EGZ7_CAMHY|nr:FlhB-like flagellar biosynthesis protein [Campylobacter hyointestinalis]KAB0614098.1 FlhB-like flagellar biosynthesis protein [Campylobacter hyointestinalis subsp. lawsonii]QKF69835.1 FlhB C-terminus-related protein [Campylobacter hyointestinalis subsp. lawsonii]RAZ25824.1 FlhB-like flagellar biosynthesis protein [Campylobacter hyointestinalis subsp. lawsonii]RAZ29806.1 FlhB-like flagellar biosynthesis protein [Campylobacter hyointestinalis subsp. lawsonii]RAZ39934.1 FlhB-like flagellar bio